MSGPGKQTRDVRFKSLLQAGESARAVLGTEPWSFVTPISGNILASQSRPPRVGVQAETEAVTPGAPLPNLRPSVPAPANTLPETRGPGPSSASHRHQGSQCLHKTPWGRLRPVLPSPPVLPHPSPLLPHSAAQDSMSPRISGVTLQEPTPPAGWRPRPAPAPLGASVSPPKVPG